MFDKFGDADHNHLVISGELVDVIALGHRSVRVGNFTEDGGRLQSSHARQVHRSFGVPGLAPIHRQKPR